PAGKNIEGREQRRLVETVKNVVRLDSVPHAHQSKRQKIAEDRGCVFARKPFAARGRKQEAHVNVVAKPKRKRDVPAVPEIADVSGEKRPVEIFRRMDAKEIAERDGKCAVAGEIEKQIKTVSIHVACERAEARARRGAVEPVLFDQRRQDELVKKSAKNAMHRTVEISEEFSPCPRFFPVAYKAPVAIDRAGGDGRKEK